MLGNGAGTGVVTSLTDLDSFTIASSVGSISQTFVYDSTPVASSFQFSTLQELANLINSVDGLTASVGGTSAAATITFSGPPDGTLTLTDVVGTGGTEIFAAGEVGAGNLETTTYLASTSATNMASGTITPNFERSVAIFDSKGGSHTLTFGFLKSTLANTWLTEVYIEPSSEIDAAAGNGQGTNGLIQAGTVTFGTDGSINTTNFSTTIPTVSTVGTLTTATTVPWAAALGVAAQTVTVNWGTDDSTNGITQFDSDSTLVSTSVDGAIFGELANITVTDLGCRDGGVRERRHTVDLSVAGRHILECCRPCRPHRQRLPGNGPFRIILPQRGEYRRIRSGGPIEPGSLNCRSGRGVRQNDRYAAGVLGSHAGHHHGGRHALRADPDQGVIPPKPYYHLPINSGPGNFPGPFFSLISVIFSHINALL